VFQCRKLPNGRPPYFENFCCGVSVTPNGAVGKLNEFDSRSRGRP
jgi:hypothetical protein